MKFIESIINRSVYSIALWLIIGAIGTMSYFTMPIDLFPDTVPPQIVVMTVIPGTSSEDVNRKVTTLIDRELKGLPGIVNVTSTSKDEISSVNAHFDYDRDISFAMTDVINAVSRIKSSFPAGTKEPQFFRITDANRPVMTLAITPVSGSSLDMKSVRLLVENDIKEKILRLKGIGKVDVFGANESEILIRLDLDKIRKYGLTPQNILNIIGTGNISIPGGYIENNGKESLIKTVSEATRIEDLRKLPVRVKNGGIITLETVAEITHGIKTPRSIYHGNGKVSIGVNILKPEGGYAIQGINSIKNFLPELRKQFPFLNFEITTDQEPIININVKGMKGALISSVGLTMLIVFLFLLDLRTSVIIGISIPLSFLSAFAFIYFTPFTINMVTLSGLIIAVGMVVDSSIVVVENVFRHLNNKKDDLITIVDKGTREVAFSIMGGMLTTVIVLIPIMFTGGYPQQVLRPLTIMISSTLIGSFLSAMTIVPLLLVFFYKESHKKDSENRSGFFNKVRNINNNIINSISEFYINILRLTLNFRVITLIICFVILAVSVRLVIPLVGRELMPNMDTGMVTVKVDLPSSMTCTEVEDSIEKIEDIIYKSPHVLNVSSVAGSEPGQVSFGAGGQLLQQIEIQINLKTRDRRRETIWEIMETWRNDLEKIPSLLSFSVSEFGATPLSTTKAPIDVMIYGRDKDVLLKIAENTMNKLKTIRGLKDLRFSWRDDKPETHFIPELEIMSLYNLDATSIGKFINLSISGNIPTRLKMNGYLDIPLRVELGSDGKKWNRPVDELVIKQEKGELYLNTLGHSEKKFVPTLVTRENLHRTIDILGINSVLPLSNVASEVEKVIKKINVPEGYGIILTGSMADMKDTGLRLAKSLAVGFIFLYIILWVLFESFWRPVLVMLSIPLSLIGAFWGLVIFNKPMCMPAMMGIILLGGTIVNNALILIDFIDNAQKNGYTRREALENSVRIRLRPILITTFSTIIGLVPLTLEMAVGLERMSPLGVVASCGLLAGTFMTMIIIPTAYDLTVDTGEKLRSIFNRFRNLKVFTRQ